MLSLTLLVLPSLHLECCPLWHCRQLCPAPCSPLPHACYLAWLRAGLLKPVWSLQCQPGLQQCTWQATHSEVTRVAPLMVEQPMPVQLPVHGSLPCHPASTAGLPSAACSFLNESPAHTHTCCPVGMGNMQRRTCSNCCRCHLVLRSALPCQGRPRAASVACMHIEDVPSPSVPAVPPKGLPGCAAAAVKLKRVSTAASPAPRAPLLPLLLSAVLLLLLMPAAACDRTEASHLARYSQ